MRRLMQLLAGLLMICWLAQVPAAAARAAPVVLQPKFHRIAGAALLGSPAYDPTGMGRAGAEGTDGAPTIVPISTNGRYVLVWRGAGRGLRRDAQRMTIIDDRTGGRRQLRFPPGCEPVSVGGAFLMFACRPARPGVQLPAQLFDLATGGWRSVLPSQALVASESQNACTVGSGCTLTPSQQSPTNCYVPGGCTLDPVRIGTYWIVWSSNYGLPCSERGPAEEEHCYTERYLVQSLDTGREGRSAVAYTERVDLNAPGLIRHLCSPLQTRQTYYLTAFADAIFVGPVEIALTDDEYAGFHRCGRDPFLSFDTLGPHANNDSVFIGWTSPTFTAPYTLQGRFLPSLRQLLVQTPAGLGPRGGFLPPIALTSRHLYLVSHNGSLERAPAPRAPRTPRVQSS